MKVSKYDQACLSIARNGWNGPTILLTAELFARSIDTVKANVESAKALLEIKPDTKPETVAAAS